MNIIDYITKTYGDIEYLSEGSCREVYSFVNDDKHIIKVPVDDYMEQSEHECSVYKYVSPHLRYLLAPITTCDYDFDGIPLIIMRKAELITDLFDENYFKSAISKYGNLEFLDDLAEFITKHKQSDLICNSDNWGIVDGRLVCIDYGIRAESFWNPGYDLNQIRNLKQMFIKIA